MKFLLAMTVALCFIFPNSVIAAQQPEVSLSLPDGYHRVSDIIPVAVRLSSAGLNLNAVDLTINYSTIGLEIIRVEKSLTNWPLWPEEPKWDNSRGQLHLTAGRPNGLIAVGATVATIYVKLPANGLWQFQLHNSSRAFINDGLGTPTSLLSPPLDVPVVEFFPFGIELSSASHPSPSSWFSESTVEVRWKLADDLKYSFSFSDDPTVIPDNDPETTTGAEQFPNLVNGIWWFTIKSYIADVGWSDVTRRSFLVDTVAPAPFTIELLPANQVDNKTVIAWTAIDSDSGVALYRLIVDGKLVGPVISPLTIRDEWLGKNISLQAVDGAGNVTGAAWRDSRQPFSWWRPGIVAGLFFGLGVVSFILIRSRRQRLS